LPSIYDELEKVCQKSKGMWRTLQTPFIKHSISHRQINSILAEKTKILENEF